MNIRVILEFDADVQAWSASIPELNHISSCGKTQDEAIEHLKEAIALLFEPVPESYLALTSITETREIPLQDLLSA